jgi:hypothetical protein
MLHLPHVAQLVGDDGHVGKERTRPQQDRPVRRVALEPAKPRQPEEPRDDPHPDAAQRHRLRVEGQTVEPGLRQRERVTLRRIHEPTL